MRNIKYLKQVFKIRRIFTLVMMLIIGLLSTPHFIHAQESVDGLDYAPNVFYQTYQYEGEGNEFAGFETTLQYFPDENGIYQFSVSSSGTTIIYIYQITSDGIYELAYFPETYDKQDLRQHADAKDELKSLVLPAKLTVGQKFNRGYQNLQSYQVVDILDTFDLLDITYYNVVVIEPVNHPEGATQRFYYAPHIGHIMDEFIFTDEESYPITSSLYTLRGPTYIWPTDFD